MRRPQRARRETEPGALVKRSLRKISREPFGGELRSIITAVSAIRRGLLASVGLAARSAHRSAIGSTRSSISMYSAMSAVLRRSIRLAVGARVGEQIGRFGGVGADRGHGEQAPSNRLAGWVLRELGQAKSRLAHDRGGFAPGLPVRVAIQLVSPPRPSTGGRTPANRAGCLPRGACFRLLAPAAIDRRKQRTHRQ
jgi:hypothetical protein